MWDKLWVMTEQQSQNLSLKVDPLSTIRNNKFITQGQWKIENLDSEGESFNFVSNISSPPLKRRYKRYGFSYFFCNTRRWTACVQQKIESVYLHVIKKHQNNLLFTYELGFCCFELNLFSHCFDSVLFEKFKPEQALWTLYWKDSLFTRNSLDLTWNVSNLCCLCFKIRHKFTINCSE